MVASIDRDTLLHRGVAEIITEHELIALLDSGRPLRLKMGFDPTAPDVHLGWAVGLRKLRQFQELGHQVILIVGDWTAQIGDPSEQASTRRMLPAELVRANAQACLRQFFRIVDPARTQVVWQSEWFGPFTLADVIQLTSKFTVAKLLSREDFAKRFAENRPITLAELIYPLLQAYDSVAIQADVEFGGTDQKFNCLAGRDLQEYMGQRPQQVFLVPLLPGTDGRKMSQSLGNYIGVEEPPNEMYGKLMSITDEVMGQYFELLTDVPMAEVREMLRAVAAREVNPMEVKMRLAREIVAQFHGPEAARQAEAHFTRVFRERQAPEEVEERPVDLAAYRAAAPEGAPEEGAAVRVNLVPLLLDLGLASSRSEARRLIQQRAVEIDGDVVTAMEGLVKPGSLLRVGKRRFVRLVAAGQA